MNAKSLGLAIVAELSMNLGEAPYFEHNLLKRRITFATWDPKTPLYICASSITTYFKSPKSYTGEDMVEISVHGGSAVINEIISLIGKNKKTRQALPGEFTRRAFENNKLDLTQVEAVSDLVNAETEYQRKQAYNQLEGTLSHKLQNIHSNFEIE